VLAFLATKDQMHFNLLTSFPYIRSVHGYRHNTTIQQETIVHEISTKQQGVEHNQHLPNQHYSFLVDEHNMEQCYQTYYNLQ
jgi:hypothetical protein